MENKSIKNHKSNGKKSLTFLLFVLSFFSLTLLSFDQSQAAINQQVNYQGKLTDSAGTAVTNGTYQMVFKLYTASSGGTAVWTETWSGASKVTVTSGLFSVMLGSITSISSVDFNQTLYLGVTVESDSEMTPRKTLGSVATAILANSALTVTTNANLTGAVTSVGNAASLGSFSSANLLGALSDETGTGLAIFGTSPTFTTGLTVPLVLGGTSTTQDLSFQTTSGIGATGADMHFLVGNNGATEALTILNSGYSGFGTTTPDEKVEIVGNIISKGTAWTTQTTPTNTWRSVAYGNGLFVAVAEDGSSNRVMTSPDAINWTSRTSAADNTWNSVTYGAGLFVAVSSSGTGNRVMSSPDGITWTSRTSAANNNWRNVTYGNNIFVAVGITAGVGNKIMTSYDGISWTLRTAPTDNDWRSVTYGNGLFVAVASAGTTNTFVMTSPDGITWTTRTSTEDNFWRDVSYGNGLFVAVSSTGTNRVMTSPDGITWTARSASVANTWFANTYGAGLWVAVAASGTGDRVMTSVDGITWRTRTSPADNAWNDIVFGNGIFVSVATSANTTSIMTSGKTDTTAFGQNNVYQGGITLSGTLEYLDTSGDHSYLFAVSELAADRTITLPLLTGNDTFVFEAHTQTLTNKTFTAPKFADLGFVADANGNEMVVFDTVTSAENYLSIVNAADATNPVLSALGDDTNVGLNFLSKATGTFNFLGNSTQAAELRLYEDTDAGTNYTAFKNSTLSADITYTLPTNDGDASQVLSSDGSGVLSWATVSSSSGWTDDGTVVRLTTSTDTVGIGTTAPGEALEVVGNIIHKGTSWTTRTSSEDNNWRDVVYGNGRFVAVSNSGSGNRVMTSPDGINWTDGVSAAGNDWRSVTYGNGLFVAVSATGTNDRVMTSPDGTTWTSRTTSAENTWNSVAYGNGTFVAISTDGSTQHAMSSPDGITWTARTTATDNTWQAVTYGNGLFVAVASAGTTNTFVMTSPDGTTWTSRTSAADNQWNDVTYGNGLFVAVSSSGTGNRVMTSPDGISWTTRTSAANNSWQGVAYGDGLFTAVSITETVDNQRIMTSPDGITWTARTSPSTDENWRAVTYGNGIFVAVANSGTATRVMTSGKTDYTPSSDNNLFQGVTKFAGGGGEPIEILGNVISKGTYWTERGNTSTNVWISIAYGNGTFAGISQSGTGTRVITSSDGITWTTRTSAADNTWTGITYGNGLFVAVSADGSNRVATSPDGITWTSRSAAEANFWNDVTYGNGLFVAVSEDGTNRVMTSPDGITWTARAAASATTWNSVTYGSGVYVAVSQSGTNNRAMTSPDGTTWTSRTTTSLNNAWESVAYGNGIFVAVSEDGTNRVMTSPTGTTWTARSAAAANQWQDIAYGDGIFVAVAASGTANRIMTSPDGITWTSRTNPDDNSWSSIAYGNGLFASLSSDGASDGNNRAMTSGKVDYSPVTHGTNNFQGGMTIYGNLGLGVASSASTNLSITQTAIATGTIKGIVYTGAVNTNQTLSTEVSSITLTTAGRQWATGAITTQREVLISQPVYSFVGASTVTDAATVGIAGAPNSSTNATLTNSHALLIQSADTTGAGAATNSYGLTVNAQSGATTNYAAAFLGGRVGVGTATPGERFSVVGDSGDNDVVSITETGGNTCTFNTTTGVFGCASDIRLKHDISSIESISALSKIAELNPVMFRYNWQDPEEPLVAGFIAQEMEKIFPDMVYTNEETGYKSLSYSTLMPYTIKAIQELNLKINNLSGIQVGDENTASGNISAFFGNVVEKVEDSTAYLKNLVVNTLKIGSPSKRTGITFFDEVTGNPYCLSVANGVTKTTPGECSVIEPINMIPEPTPKSEILPTDTNTETNTDVVVDENKETNESTTEEPIQETDITTETPSEENTPVEKVAIEEKAQETMTQIETPAQ